MICFFAPDIVSEMTRGHQARWGHMPSQNGTFAVPCGPLGDWLALLHLSRIDFFSLDVEGAEMPGAHERQNAHTMTRQVRHQFLSS